MSEESENGSVFDAIAFRETMVDEELMREVIAEFNEESESILGKARTAMSGGDADALHKASHALKGLVGNFYAERAFGHASELDAVARAGDLEGAGRLYPRMESEVVRLKDALGEFGKGLGEGDS